MNRRRRRFIRLASGGVVLAATAGSLTSCRTGMPEMAVAAWDGPDDSERDSRRWALAHALLAPNPHNMQPWIADLRTEGRIVLLYDQHRSLAQTDPIYRQLIIGCGAFLEILGQALRERGFAAVVTYFPEGEFGDRPDERPVALVDLGPRTPPQHDPLFAQVLRRHTNRTPFDTGRPILEPDLRALAATAAAPDVVESGVATAVAAPEFRRIATDAWRVEVTTPRVLRESIELTRVGSREIERHRDGISVTGFVPVMARVLGLFTAERAMDPDSAGFQRVLQMGVEQAATANAWLWQSTAGNSRVAQLEAGRAYVRAHLKATELGIAMQPMSQVLQEYPEMAALQKQLYEHLGVDPALRTIQMLARLGRAGPVAPSPRRRLADIIRA